MALYPGYYHIDICSGGGMLGLALKLALGERVRTVAYVEREAYAAATLVARMEEKALDNAPVWDDVNTITNPEFLEYVQGFRPLAISAGYPCQPFSHAGKRLGTADPRHLWPAIDRFIGAAQPELVFLENVPGHLRLGFGTVRRNLESRGYTVEAGLFSAAEVGASHERERLFILAVARGHGNDSRRAERAGQQGRSETLQPSGEADNATSSRFRAGEGCGAGVLCGGGQQGFTKGRPVMVHPELSERRQGERGGSGRDGDDAGRNETAGGAGKSSEAVADFKRQREREQGGEGSGRPGFTGNGGHMADPEGERSTGERIHESQLPNYRLPLFAPGPGDSGAWREILERFPEVEPGICRTADGLAGRLDPDRLRLTGNGVVPLAAAYAAISLMAVHITKRMEAAR